MKRDGKIKVVRSYLLIFIKYKEIKKIMGTRGKKTLQGI